MDKKYVLMEVHEKGLCHGKIHHYVPWNARESERLSLSPSTMRLMAIIHRRYYPIIDIEEAISILLGEGE
jgi:hypothetical protein